MSDWLVDHPDFERPDVWDFGRDGNVFALIGQVSRALTRAGYAEVADEFVERARASRSYDEVLYLCMEYAEVHTDSRDDD